MEALAYLTQGFLLAAQPGNLLAAFIGAVAGTLVGVLPGFGPSSALAILIPFTAVLPPEAMLIAMAGIYYGAQYGGSTSAILLNMPGEVSSIPTCLDGYPLTKQGKGGIALGIAAVSSFVAGTIGLIAVAAIGPALAHHAAKFGPPEYFGLMVLASAVVVSLSGPSLAKGSAAALIGFVISLVGIDQTLGVPRFTFGLPDLLSGLSLISLVIGLFAIAEVIEGLERRVATIAPGSIGSVYPGKVHLKRTIPAMLRGSGVGFVLGLLPGCSPAVTTFLAYDFEKKVSSRPEEFGHGALEGVAAPEAANNATASSGFIPLLSLGIPPSPPLALLLGGLMIYGVQPGPLMYVNHPQLVWTVIASMFIGNVILLALNLPLVGLWARLATVPYGIVAPVVLLLCIAGAYSINHRMFDVWIALAFGLVGYLMKKAGWPTIPLLLCLILGPILEKSLLQSLILFQGDVLSFARRPLALTLIISGLLIIVFVLLQRKKPYRMR